MKQITKEELKAGYLLTLNTKRSYLLIPNKEGLQLVHVNTNPEAINPFNTLFRKEDILTWLCSLNNVNEDLSINIYNSILYINEVHDLSEFGNFWDTKYRELLWKREIKNNKTVGGHKDE
jgi:hypothetical protein